MTRRAPGFLTGAFTGLTPKQAGRRRARAIMGLPDDTVYPKPNPPEFEIHDRGSAVYQLQRARAALRYGWIDQATFEEVEKRALFFSGGTPIQETVDDVRLFVDPPKPEPHAHDGKVRKHRQ